MSVLDKREGNEMKIIDKNITYDGRKVTLYKKLSWNKIYYSFDEMNWALTINEAWQQVSFIFEFGGINPEWNCDIYYKTEKVN